MLDALSAQLHSQRDSGSRYLIGADLTALDIYWACFSQMLDALPQEVNPMPDFLRRTWNLVTQALDGAGYELDPALLAHRDFIFPTHLQWPLDY